MTAEQLVPGISRYPDLAEQLNQRLDRLAGSRSCSSCVRSALAREFRTKMQRAAEKALLMKGKPRD